MAESIQKELDKIELAINEFEQALPQVIGISTFNDGILNVLRAADAMKEISFDPDMKALAITLKILSNSPASSLRTVVYQSLIADILEMLVQIKSQVQSHGLPKTTDSKDLRIAGEFLIRYAGRVTNRFKIKITFSPDYEAKAIRAFMIVKELQESCRFLSMDPDLVINSNPNLDVGLQIDVLTQESAEELHRVVGSVLEVQSVQMFIETMNQPVKMLDPPQIPESFDTKVIEFLNG